MNNLNINQIKKILKNTKTIKVNCLTTDLIRMFDTCTYTLGYDDTDYFYKNGERPLKNNQYVDIKKYLEHCLKWFENDVRESLYNSDLHNIITNVKAESLHMPKYYNYTTDSFKINFDVDLNLLMELLEENNFHLTMNEDSYLRAGSNDLKDLETLVWRILKQITENQFIEIYSIDSKLNEDLEYYTSNEDVEYSGKFESDFLLIDPS
ncbi:MAG: hypothetical protein ACRCXZ_03280 [Patescibacteria group bacterium]